MTAKELDAILADLDKKRQHKKDVLLAKAQAEINTVLRESDAYFDGLYDAIKAVKALLPDTPKGG